MKTTLFAPINKFSIALLLGLFFSTQTIQAQINITGTQNADTSELGHVPELEYIASNLPKYKSFMFRRVVQEYIANENGFLLDVKLDTAFLIFKRSDKDSTIYMGTYHADDEGSKAFAKANDVEKIPLEIKLAPTGKIKELVNWKQFRDYFVSSLSKQAQADLITPA